MNHRAKLTTGLGNALLACVIAAAHLVPITARQAGSQPVGAADRAGATTTRLANGRWLVVGGEGTETRAWVWDPQTQTATATATLQVPRAWHTATVLPDGTVLLIGGRNSYGIVEPPEIFDPDTLTFSPTSIVGAIPRASHTSTLLTDARRDGARRSNPQARRRTARRCDVEGRQARGTQ